MVGGNTGNISADGFFTIAGAHGSDTETRQRIPSNGTLTWSRLTVRVTANTSTGGTDSTFTLRVNFIGTIVVTITEGIAATYVNNTDRATSTDLQALSIELILGSLTTGMTFRGRQIQCET